MISGKLSQRPPGFTPWYPLCWSNFNMYWFAPCFRIHKPKGWSDTHLAIHQLTGEPPGHVSHLFSFFSPRKPQNFPELACCQSGAVMKWRAVSGLVRRLNQRCWVWISLLGSTQVSHGGVAGYFLLIGDH